MPLFSAITRKMNWLTERQKVLAENIANADTPGFKASDLRSLDFSAELASTQGGSGGGGAPKLALAATDPGHLTASPSSDPSKAQTNKKAPQEINGNSVSLEDEVTKLSETSVDYQMMTNLYKKQIGLIKTAIGQSSGS